MNDTNLAILDFEYNDGIIWFVDVLAGCLWKKSIDSGTIERITELPRISNKEQYRALCLSNGKLFIAPLFAKDLIIYDIEHHITTSINLEGIIDEDKPNYVEMIQYGKFIFCISMSNAKILRINAVDNSFDIFEYDGKILDKGMGRPFFRRVGSDGRFIFIGLCNEPKMIKFDMEKLSFEMIDLSFLSCDGFSSCNCIKNKIILVSFDNSKSFIINRSYRLLKEFILDSSIVFANYLVVGDEFFCVDCNGKGACKVIDTETYTINSIFFDVEKKEKVTCYFTSNDFSLAGRVINDELWIFVTKEYTLNRFTRLGHLIDKISFDVNDNDCKVLNKILGEKLKKEYDSNNIVKEDNYINIKSFINSVL